LPKRVAYGCSKLLHFYLTETQDHDFAFIVDRNYEQKEFCGIEVIKPDALAKRGDLSELQIAVFAVSNDSLNAILSFLSTLNFQLGKNVFLYAELFRESFEDTMKRGLGWDADRRLLQFASAYTLNSRKPVHTTICGTWLFLEALRRVANVPGDVAEVGAFEGGNILCAVQSPVWPNGRSYYGMDSFEGFPALTIQDPGTSSSGDYRPRHTMGEILTPFGLYPDVHIIKGFVPGTFSQLPVDGRYSLVFYDCDLYEPARATLEYFWPRLSPGGVILVGDYVTDPGGYTGVKRATDEFFADKGGIRAEFWHNTIAAVLKP
jgi:hypothetical protein